VTDEVKRLPRKERAARTRRTIVEAASAEFRSGGYHGTTMAAIARRAGVAVQTVYFVFHTKAALLTAAIDAAVMGEDEPLPPQLTPWWIEGTSTTDGRRAIDLFVTNVSIILGRSASLDRVLLAASTTDPEIDEVIAHHERLRSEGYREYVEALTANGLLGRGLDVSEATDVLLTLVGPSVFLDLTEQRGWSVDRYAAWTTTTLSTLLLDAPGATPASSEAPARSHRRP
jgi:AcrR family transcriptional regulator